MGDREPPPPAYLKLWNDSIITSRLAASMSPMPRPIAAVFLLVSLSASPAFAQNRAEDTYTRYELLAPESASFRIVYDVTAVSPGARYFFNPIRIGSETSDESVIDMASGTPLPFDVVSGAEARESGLRNADLEGQYIRVTLARPVPEGGEQRIRIIKTYRDPKSYMRDGDTVVF